jgi:acetyl-CoA acetyltransferase
MRTFDCNVGNDGASAVLVTTPERARDLRARPVTVASAAWSTGGCPTSHVANYYRPDITYAEDAAYIARDLFARTDLSIADVDFAEIYDHMSPLTLMCLEGLGFCERGGGEAFVDEGRNITIGGRLPLNTHGGHLGEAYIQTMNAVVEAVRQLRGEAAVQVPDARAGLVVAGTLVPNSGLLLQS